MIDKKIEDFIDEHHLLSLAVTDGEKPYCASCFFAFSKKDVVFIIASSNDTKHVKKALLNPHVAGTIALETSNIGEIRGIQFEGLFKKASKEEKQLYFKSFPYALAMLPTLWSIDVRHIKFTDNRLGFGTKLEYFKQN
ncbi:MAG: pyridoxamine 5'-phosphate oxidase family protein [Sulfurospirillaceae bacterium]|nr:pyridoxamine 5'-phosphate oxidase family protein [Sulfurospirillaceae bacterium]